MTLAYVLRNLVKNLLIDEHECAKTGCQGDGYKTGRYIVESDDTATFRVVTHVTVVELMEQGVILASRGLQEHETDTYYSFKFEHQDAVTVATVFLIRQYVRFPNFIASKDSNVREVYDR